MYLHFCRGGNLSLSEIKSPPKLTEELGFGPGYMYSQNHCSLLIHSTHIGWKSMYKTLKNFKFKKFKCKKIGLKKFKFDKMPMKV